MKYNILFNFISAATIAILTIVFTPLYVHYLGVEAFGMIGFLGMLQASLALFDLGLSQVLARQLARYLGGAISTQSIRDLLRSVEFIGWSIAVAVVVLVLLASGWIAGLWLKPGRVSAAELASSIQVMGIILGLRLLEGLYRGGAIGIDRQFELNLITTLCAIVRAFGSLVLLAYFSRAVLDFFLWQAVVSFVQVGLLVALVHSSVPRPPRPAVFAVAELKTVWRFSAGLTVSSLLGILLLQMDKLLLSNLLLLPEFGEYTLAATLAAAPHLFAAPIVQAAQPRFARAMAEADEATLSESFHISAQFLTVLVGSASCIILFFSPDVLNAWLHDDDLAMRIAPLVSVLAVGSLINALGWLPYALQLASGWTKLSVLMNAVAVAMLVPALIIVVPSYGSIGAAWIWIALNVGSILVSAHFMFQRILTGHKYRWYFHDVGLPLLVALVSAGVLKTLVPTGGGTLPTLLGLATVSTLTLASATLAAPRVRSQCLVIACRIYGRMRR